MNLLELERSLPNGLHDSHIRGFSVDYVKREAIITLDILVGIPEGGTEAAREAYKSALLKLSGLEYFIIEPPDSKYKYSEPGSLWIDASPLETAKLKSKIKIPPQKSSKTFAYLSFVQDWNACIDFAATDASLEWR